MKRLISAGLLLVFVVTAYVSSYFYIKKTCDETIELVRLCEENYKDGKNAYDTAEKIDEVWVQKEKTLSFFVNHDRIDEVELELSSLLLYSRTKDEILFYENIETLKMLLSQIKEDSMINAHAIF